MDVTRRGVGFVEGHVKAVYGIDMEIVQYLDTTAKRDLGIVPDLHIRNLSRVRLMSDGTVESVVGGQ